MWSISYGITNYPSSGCGRGHVNFWEISDISETVQDREIATMED